MGFFWFNKTAETKWPETNLQVLFRDKNVRYSALLETYCSDFKFDEILDQIYPEITPQATVKLSWISLA